MAAKPKPLPDLPGSFIEDYGNTKIVFLVREFNARSPTNPETILSAPSIAALKKKIDTASVAKVAEVFEPIRGLRLKHISRSYRHRDEEPNMPKYEVQEVVLTAVRTEKVKGSKYSSTPRGTLKKYFEFDVVLPGTKGMYDREMTEDTDLHPLDQRAALIKYVLDSFEEEKRVAREKEALRVRLVGFPTIKLK